ncbi:MAG: LysM peptidoglycan-binding domain-containing protein [Psychroflexus sp.]|nr:LysM peptidoglycan-binding domain-containing protein [Psychroflexus sp.]
MLVRNIIFIIAFFCFASMQSQQLEAYEVKKGETLQSIARQFKVSANQILEYNPDLSKSGALESQTIFIPVQSQSKLSFIDYKVTSGETLWSIAQSYSLKVKDIKKHNPSLNNRELESQEIIRIPVRKLNTNSSKSINQSITNSNFKTLKHLVLPKETKYGIARQYGVEVSDLEKSNPSIKTLQPGQILTIRRKLDKNKKKIPAYIGYRYYKVPDDATIYSLTNEYDVDQKELEAINPALKNLGLQAGMILKLPKEITADQTTGLFSDEPIDFRTKIKNYDRKYIDLFLPLNLERFDNDTLNKQKILAENQLTQIASDFYMGALIAIDSAKTLGIDVDLRLFDTKSNPAEVDDILNNYSFSQTQLIIGPVIPQNLQKVINDLSNQQIPVVAPLSEPVEMKDNAVTTLPGESIRQKALISYLKSNYENQNLLVVSDSADYKTNYRFKYTFPEAKIIETGKNYVQQTNILQHLSTEKENFVVLTSDELGIVESTINHLHSLEEYPIKKINSEGEKEVVKVKNHDIRLFSSSRKNFFEDEIDNDYLSKMKFIVVDNSRQLAINKPTEFMHAFYEENGFYPNKYCIRGYDLMFDLILKLSASADFYSTLALPGFADYNFSKFSYQKNSFNSGYINEGYYFIQYDQDLTTKLINTLKEDKSTDQMTEKIKDY